MIYLNIGSNLNSIFGDRFTNITKAIDFLIQKKIKIKKFSDFFETPSYPNKKNPKFINICLEISFDSKEKTLLKIISSIQKKLGRKLAKKNDPRICDIDIIDFNQKVIESDLLILPHPRLHLRNFVLYPLMQINPNWSHPVSNKKIADLIEHLNACSRIEITRINKSVIFKR